MHEFRGATMNLSQARPKVIKDHTLIPLLRISIFCHFGSTSFVVPIRPKDGILNRGIRVNKLIGEKKTSPENVRFLMRSQKLLAPMYAALARWLSYIT